MKNIRPGQILFDLAYSDRDYCLPILQTLVYLGEEEFDDAMHSKFLVANGLSAGETDRDVLYLTEDQASALLDVNMVIALLQKVPSQVNDLSDYI